jgi:hypothetical protein
MVPVVLSVAPASAARVLVALLLATAGPARAFGQDVRSFANDQNCATTKTLKTPSQM